MKFFRATVCFLLLTGVLSVLFSVEQSSLGEPDPVRTSIFKPLFPDALTWEGLAAVRRSAPEKTYNVPSLKELAENSRRNYDLQSFLLNNDVFALYGKPGAYTMGILGRYSLEEIEGVMNDFVALYDAANGNRGIIPAFYIIFGTCWPEGEIGLLKDSVVKEYVEFARERGWLVFLDHQIGRYSVESAVEKLLPWLKYDNVHLALDPEWRTEKPMQEIGFVSAGEINTAQQMIQDYMIENALPGRRMLVIHQFKAKMIQNRQEVRSDFDLVKLIHCADGFGSPQLKKNTYAFNAVATNIPLKSFKLFLKPTVEGAGYDSPLMSPEEVFSLNPRPYLIMYQ